MNLIHWRYKQNWVFLVAQMVKNLPAMQEIWVWSLGWEDPLEEGMAAHSIILAWRFPWTEEPGKLQSIGRKESDVTEETAHIHAQPLRNGSKLPLTTPRVLASEIKRTFLSCNLAGFWGASSILHPNEAVLSWYLASRGFPKWSHQLWQRAGMVPISPLLLASWAREEDLGGTFLAVAETICFRDPPHVSLAPHWLSTYASHQWNGKMDLDKLMNPKTK